MAAGGNSSSQYEYSIDGQIDPPNMRSGPGGSLGPSQNTIGLIKGNTIASKSSGSGGASQTQSVPKRTPHSELTSYQSEKRLKEYKQAHHVVQHAHQHQLERSQNNNLP